MLPVKYRALKNLVVVHCCGRQLARWLGLAALVYLTMEGATPHCGACRHSLQCHRKPNWCFGVLVWMWNVVSVSGKGGDVCEELRKKMIGVCWG